MVSSSTAETVPVAGMQTTTHSSAGDDAYSVSSDSSYASGDSVSITSSEGPAVAVGEVKPDDFLEVQQLVEKETIHVQRWRCVVFVMLLIVAGVLTFLSYASLTKQNNEEFEIQHQLFSETIQTALAVRLESMLQEQIALANRFTLVPDDTTVWPMVTIPHFDVESRSVAVQHTSFLPLVTVATQNEIDAWNTYARKEQPGVPNLFNLDDNNNRIPITAADTTTDDIAAPYWQISSAANYTATNNASASAFMINYNAMNQTWSKSAVDAVLGYRGVVILPYQGNGITAEPLATPRAVVTTPIFQLLDNSSSTIVGVLSTILQPWQEYFLSDIPLLLPNGDTNDNVEITCVLTCGEESFTYQLQAKGVAVFAGDGDLHDTQYDSMRVVLSQPFPPGYPLATWAAFTYPTRTLEEQYKSQTPMYMALFVALSFSMMAVIFMIYEGFVQRKNSKILSAAAKFNRVVSSLFPSNFRHRLFGNDVSDETLPIEKTKSQRKLTRRRRWKKKKEKNAKRLLKSFIEGKDGEEVGNGDAIDDLIYKNKPIADLYTDTTVIFADIVGFTAWSSVREPTQVFILLETLYRAFDLIAQRRRVFKVETVGDCYVAVTGLPDPRPDHAVVMARFAHDCLMQMKNLTHKLEVRLGPDTGDLSMRVGLHSGPVTAGVLRGERSRFQLFGDTMNTASRMESTGERGRIHVSQETADLLIAAGKGRWLAKREDKVIAKGKGELITYWLTNIGSHPNGTVLNEGADAELASHQMVDMTQMEDQGHNKDNLTENVDLTNPIFTEKTNRLINWNVEVLRRLLKLIVARRNTIAGTIQTALTGRKMSLGFGNEGSSNPIEEVQEVIKFADFHIKIKDLDPDSVILDEAVEEQLYQFVVSVAAMYRDNPFHNFDHASHVTMSVTKLLSRIVAPSKDPSEFVKESDLQDHTYGITADPLTQFACVFSALVHDVDHTGVPNAQLIKEKSELAAAYENKSVAEQNSVDLAWSLLMDDQYVDLCNTIYANPTERQRFRQLVVNSVMATDILDKDLKQLRNDRWDRAFTEKPARRGSLGGFNRENIHRKATIVIEHLIQASDVAHTMQHWHIYRKWNERLFHEMSLAYRCGRAERNPADFWYEGELGFFDYYIIPLAKKLKDCGVFGVSSDEYLTYAKKNRQEWESRGREVLAEMVESFHKIYGPPPPTHYGPEPLMCAPDQIEDADDEKEEKSDQ